MTQFVCVADLSQSANCYRTPVWLCTLSPGSLSAMRKHRRPLLPAAGARLFLTRQKNGSLPSGEGRDGGGRCWESSELARGLRRVGRAAVADAAGVGFASLCFPAPRRGRPRSKRDVVRTVKQTSRVLPVCWPGRTAFHQETVNISFRRAVVCLLVAIYKKSPSNLF